MRNIFKFKSGSKEEKSKAKVKPATLENKDKKAKQKSSKEEALQSKSFYGDDEDLGYC